MSNMQREKGKRRIVPLESEEQQALFQWVRLMEGRHPELRLLYHIPNGGLRNKPIAVRLTAQGGAPWHSRYLPTRGAAWVPFPVY